MQSHSRLANAVPAAMTKMVSGVRVAALLSLVLLAAPPWRRPREGVAPRRARGQHFKATTENAARIAGNA